MIDFQQLHVAVKPWTKYSPDRGETLVLDDVPAMKNDPDREARSALPKT